MEIALLLGIVLVGVLSWLILMWSPSPSADAAYPHPVVKYLTKCARRLAILFRIFFLLSAVIGFVWLYFGKTSEDQTAGYIFTGIAGAFLVLTLASSACSEA